MYGDCQKIFHFWTFFPVTDENNAGYYQQIEFAEGELLIASTCNNNYIIEVWDWRKKFKLLIQKTDFFIAHQTIK